MAEPAGRGTWSNPLRVTDAGAAPLASVTSAVSGVGDSPITLARSGFENPGVPVVAVAGRRVDGGR